MTRATAVAVIKRVLGTADPIVVLNALQDAGLVAAVLPRDAATGSLERLVRRCGRNEALLTKVGDGVYDGENHVLCPVCGDSNVHHENRADIINGKDAYAAAKMVRGDVIAIPMYCEGGHKFVLCFGFHKGCTLTWCVKYTGKLASPNVRVSDGANH